MKNLKSLKFSVGGRGHRGFEISNPWVIKFHGRLGHCLMSLQARDPSLSSRKKPVAPYCAIPRDDLSPQLRAMGFLVSQHGLLGAIPPPPFLSVSPLESMRSGGAIPAPQKGYLSDTCAIPYENKANGCDPPTAMLSRRVLRDMGGVSRTGPVRERSSFIFVSL